MTIAVDWDQCNVKNQTKEKKWKRTGLQIYFGPGSFSHDFKVWPITFQGSGPSEPILFSCENIHLTVSLRTPQNRKYM